MRTIIVLLISVSFMLSGCATKVDMYTFKKDRVDQTMKGNTGYLEGQPKNMPQFDENRKRTLIGIDIDLDSDDEDVAAHPVSGAGAASAESTVKKDTEMAVVTEDVQYQEKAKASGVTETSHSSSKRSVTSFDDGTETVVVDKEEVESEANWIK